MNNFEKPNSLDELEKKLYSPNQGVVQKERKQLRPQEYTVPQDWERENVNVEESPFVIDDSKPNWFFRFFILALIFFLGALGYVGVKLYFGSGIDAQNVDVLINAPLAIGAGEVFDFEVVMQNKNQINMRYVDVEVQFPDGTRSVSDIGTDYKTAKESIDTIEIGEIVKKNYGAMLFGEEGEKKEVTIFLTYKVQDSTTLFKKEKKFDVVLKSTPVRLTVTNVKEITSDQDIAFTIELVSNSTQTLKNVIVQATYPFGFMYKSSSIAPQDDKKTWIIPSLAPKETLTFTLRGAVEGQNNDEKFFNFLVGLKDEETDSPQVVFTKKGTTVSLARPFLELNFAIDEKDADTIVVNPDENQNATISFKNNTDSPLRNAIISLLLNGEVIQEDSIQVSDGFYQSLNDTIMWDSSTSEDLIAIPQGSSGAVSFSFNGFGLSTKKIIINPEALFTIEVKANRNLQNQVSEIIENSVVQKIRFNTQLNLESLTQYYSSVFANSGPIPPKAEQKTTYTGLISIKNTSNIVADGIVTMRIPNYVTYEGVFSPGTEQVSYDSVTRIVTWKVGDINTKTGYEGISPRTLSLQVSFIPSVSQVGTSPELIQNIKFTGTDIYTQEEIEKTAEPITTQIQDAKDYFDSQVSR
jgi:hypothetical protein